ncbi:MAG: hypothetical protein CMJ78_02465 [Planctomycetaceae bacterium]|nr:hypothetical protein [Planctomycetaceae bacterium]
MIPVIARKSSDEPISVNSASRFNRMFCAVVLGILVAGVNLQSTFAQEESEAASRQFNVAVGFQNAKLYEEAIDEWKAFQKKFADDPRQDHAWHYLGTCQLQAKQVDAAIVSLRMVVTKYPKFKLFDATLLNYGSALYEKAQKTQKPADYAIAEKQFSDLIAKYPRSEHASRAYYNRGESQYAQKKLDAAVTSYEKLISSFPKDPLVADAYYSMGVAQETLDQSAAAEKSYTALLTKFPNHPLKNDVRMRQAEMLYAVDKFEQAEKVFEQLSGVDGYKLADFAMVRQARCLYEQEEYEKAGRLYWEVPRKFKGTKYYDDAVLSGSRCFFLNDDFEVARQGFEIVSKRDTDKSAEADYWIARSWIKDNNAAKALEILDAAIRKHAGDDFVPQMELTRADAFYEIEAERPKAVALYATFAQKYSEDELAPQAKYMAALTALQVGQHAQAKSHGDAFLAKYEDNKLKPDVLFIAAESRLLQEDYAGAETRYASFIADFKQHASFSEAQVRYGLVLQLQKKFDAAIRHLGPLATRLTDDEKKSEAQYLLGRSYLGKDNFAQAVSFLEQSVATDSDRSQNDEALLALAQAHQKQDAFEKSDAVLKRLINQYPNSKHLDEANYRIAESLYAQGELAQAATAYAGVVQKWPNGEYASFAQYGIGWSQFGLGQFEAAVNSLTRLLQNYQNAEVRPRAFYVRAMSHQQLGDFAKAEADVGEFLKTNPKQNDRLDAQYVLGLCQVGQQRYEAASGTFKEILKSDDYAGADKVYYELAWAMLELGKDAESAVTFQELAKKHPTSPLAAESLFRVAESQYDSEKFDDAAVTYFEAQQKASEPDLREKAIHKLGWCYLKQDKFDKASQTFEVQLKAVPSGELTEDAQFLLGECEFNQDKWQEAMTRFDKVAGRDDSRYKALATYRCGQCAGSLKKWEDSAKFYRQILANYSEFEQTPEARYGLGWALHNQGELDEAVKLYEKVTEETQTETAAKARFMIGEVCFAQKKHKDAIKHFLRTVFAYNHDDWSPLAHFEAGRCFEVTKDVAKALAQYKIVVEKYPNHAKAKLAQQRIAALK